MTPDRWRQINELYHEALELDKDAQRSFLDAACDGDVLLREEVSSLIASHEQAGSFISEPALKLAARALAEDQAGSLVGRSFSHYRIESLIAVGGMGQVYLAEDTKLDRQVAVKVLNERFSRDQASLDRFVQEAKAASALNHPNILVIHEIGVSDEANYIVSEFIEGRTLREIIGGSPMALGEVMDLSIQIGNALRAAHEANLIHRDIKPENMMLRPDGYLKVLDFGLAKLVERSNHSMFGPDENARGNNSVQGVILGTVRYMSPEQARGEWVDQRTDIFSLGVVMQEMLVGINPFAGNSASDTFANLINGEPPPLSHFVADLPDELQRIISKMLQKRREDRYQTMADLLDDLKNLREHLQFDEKLEGGISREVSGTPKAPSATAQNWPTGPMRGFSEMVRRHVPLTATVVLLASLGSIGLADHYLSRQKTTAEAGGDHSIAVLPLKPVDPAHRDDMYEMGIADSIILSLSSMKGLVVRPLSSTRKYVDVEQNPLTAGTEQKVDYVLASNYQLAGGKIRVTAQLFNVASGRIEDTYKSEHDAANVFATQDAVAADVGKALSVRFATGSNRRTLQRGTSNEDAYRLYLQGVYLNGKRTPADARRAIEALDQAVRLDPNYARAWARKAQAHLTDFSGSPRLQYQKSMEAVGKALALDGNLAEAHSVLCSNKMSYEWDFDGAKRECERALALDPNSSLAHLNYSHYLVGQGHSEEAIAEAKTAIDLEPTNLGGQRQYGIALYYARRYPEAVTQFKRVQAMDDGFNAPYNWLVAASEMQGDYPAAFESLMKMKAVYRQPQEAVQAFRSAYQTAGWPGLLRERARRRDAVSFRPARGGVYFQGAVEQAKVGDKEKAFEYLERSFQSREYWMMYLKVEPGLDSLRQDPRLTELIRRVGLL